MPRVRGIVNLFSAPKLGVLTNRRNFGSVTFLGRYGLIDFIMSDFANSGIDQVDILAKDFPTSVRNHISQGSTFLHNTKIGSLTIVANEMGVDNKQEDNEITNILANKFNPDKLHADYILIAPAHLLMILDFHPFIEKHIESGKDISVIGLGNKNLDGYYADCHRLIVKDDKLVEIAKDGNQEGIVSLEVAIMSKDIYAQLIKEQPSVSKTYGFFDMLNYYLRNDSRSFEVQLFKGVVLPITSLENYTHFSFWMLPYENRRHFFEEDELPVYTKSHDTPPVLYKEGAEVTNSFIANGSVINGTVRNSIVSRDVKIEEGAVVENSILFTGTEIGKNARLHYVITDKSVVIKDNVSVEGGEKELLLIHQGEIR